MTTEDPYSTESHTSALLKYGAEYRRIRLADQDMLNTDEAALLTGTSRVTINLWIKKARCIGLTQMRRGFKLPRWQFELDIFPTIEPVFNALQTHDGWQVLAFFETPHPALDNMPPRLALERGADPKRIVDLATAAAYE